MTRCIRQGTGGILLRVSPDIDFEGFDFLEETLPAGTEGLRRLLGRGVRALDGLRRFVQGRGKLFPVAVGRAAYAPFFTEGLQQEGLQLFVRISFFQFFCFFHL